MAIRLSALLDRIPGDTYDRVDRTRKRLGSMIRDALRQETGLLLNRLDSSLPDEKQEMISVPVCLVSGLPESLHDFTFNDSLALALTVSPYRLDLERTKAGLLGSLPLINELARLDAGRRVLKGREESAGSTLSLVDDLLKLIDQEDPIKAIVGVNEDVLGAYIYRSSLFRGQGGDPAAGKIELYWSVIGLVARMLGVGVEALAAVTLIHEVAHAYTHLGADIDGQRWSSRDFAESDHALKEGLAQYYTHLVSRRVENQLPGTHTAYVQLLQRQPDAYHTHLPWIEGFRPEEIRLAMLSVRRSGVGRSDQFLAELKEAQGKLRVVAK
jgi:hypothetical protein